MKLWEIDEQIKLVCPIHGISSDGVISFKDEATEEERTAGQALIDTLILELTS